MRAAQLLLAALLLLALLGSGVARRSARRLGLRGGEAEAEEREGVLEGDPEEDADAIEEEKEAQELMKQVDDAIAESSKLSEDPDLSDEAEEEEEEEEEESAVSGKNTGAAVLKKHEDDAEKEGTGNGQDEDGRDGNEQILKGRNTTLNADSFEATTEGLKGNSSNDEVVNEENKQGEKYTEVDDELVPPQNETSKNGTSEMKGQGEEKGDDEKVEGKNPEIHVNSIENQTSISKSSAKMGENDSLSEKKNDDEQVAEETENENLPASDEAEESETGDPQENENKESSVPEDEDQDQGEGDSAIDESEEDAKEAEDEATEDAEDKAPEKDGDEDEAAEQGAEESSAKDDEDAAAEQDAEESSAKDDEDEAAEQDAEESSAKDEDEEGFENDANSGFEDGYDGTKKKKEDDEYDSNEVAHQYQNQKKKDDDSDWDSDLTTPISSWGDDDNNVELEGDDGFPDDLESNDNENSMVYFKSDDDRPRLLPLLTMVLFLGVAYVCGKQLIKLTSETDYSAVPTNEDPFESSRQRRSSSWRRRNSRSEGMGGNGVPITPDVVKLN